MLHAKFSKQFGSVVSIYFLREITAGETLLWYYILIETDNKGTVQSQSKAQIYPALS
jgi:hypothetical protein